ncbi:hypothetical protein PFICI_02343 [Pestalotiopsis fici W106-1]|uniref:Cytochrome b2 n=1 Tax=Pestalotiopsis fici (strain W106-1 / CGMCC3.15140) TaxID=1229662 RepID=W3XDZ9_PESFW|nr:uncharacterized protein PFICI_02343 [Pestalotiopsis fici W106-1]ETS84318.1 hypothetical protein PFICI_02343 [Pestalotiopsis fici W106-1]
MLTAADVAKHDSKESCWVIVAGFVYDVTEFLNNHPGGAASILRYAGRMKDATDEYNLFHAPTLILKELSKDKHLGPIDIQQVIGAQHSAHSVEHDVMPLSICQSLDDIRAAAEVKLSARARTYFASGAESMTSVRNNRLHWEAISFYPRILRNVSSLSMTCRVMGSPSSLPIFIAPAAAAKLGHPEGELCLARGAARMAIPQCVCTYSSFTNEEIVQCFENEPLRRGGALFFQLYVPKIKKEAEHLIKRAKSLNFQALVITVDSPVIGKREDDDRLRTSTEHRNEIESQPPGKYLPGEEAPTLRGVHCSTLEWSDIPWIRTLWGSKPIILKGIQSAEDAYEATKHDLDGIYLSNHGGRQLDFAPSSVQTLLEINAKYPQVLKMLDIYVDGGVSRGSDVVKALCLGAKAVGIGRGFMYALSAYGTDGVLRAIEFLSDEIQTTLRLLGVTDIAQLNPAYINTRRLANELGIGHVKAVI